MSKQYLFRNEVALPLMDLLDNARIPAMTNQPAIQTIWAGFLHGLVDLVENTVPNCSVTTHDLDLLADAKENLVEDKNLPTVTLDAYDTYGNFPLQLSRHFNTAGEFLGIGKRPGTPDLSDQFARLEQYSSGSDIILFEDDIFTGTTARTTMNMLERYGIGVFQFIAGIQVVHSPTDPRITAVHTYDPADVYELTDPRDFLIGGYGAGLVSSVPFGLARVPYIAPYVDIAARASIPADATNLFSSALLELNKEVFTELGDVADAPILVKQGSKPFVDFANRMLGRLTASQMTMVEFCELTQGLL